MKISRSTGYALLAVAYVAQQQKHGIVLSQNISKKYGIPLEYLLKILQQLVRAGVLRSKRGPRGGFLLARPAMKISLLEIVEAVEGPMTGQLNLAELTPREKLGAKADKIYKKAVMQAKAVFQKAKLSELVTS